MKLRIQGNSLRLRLSVAESRALAADGQLEESVTFGPDRRLSYGIRVVPGLAWDVRYDDRQLMVLLPAALAADWLSTGRVAVEERLVLSEGEPLRLLLEKDYVA